MAQSPFERKLDKIKREVEQLKIAHDAVANLHKAELLKTQRALANESVRNVCNSCLVHAKNLEPVIGQRFVSQLSNEVKDVNPKIAISENPLPLMSEFRDKCRNRLHKLGIQFMDDGFYS